MIIRTVALLATSMLIALSSALAAETSHEQHKQAAKTEPKQAVKTDPKQAEKAEQKKAPVRHAKKAKKKAKEAASTTAYKQGMAKMHCGMNISYSGDADTDFARGMVPHHQGAIDMAEVVLKHGRDPEVRKLAEYIIYMQKQEIAFMNHWLNVRGRNLPKAENNEAVAALKAADERMHHAMMIKYTGDADLDFVNGMIPHHQGAIDMAVVLLKHGVSPELNKLAHDIIRSQGQEIRQMQAWRERYLAAKQ